MADRASLQVGFWGCAEGSGNNLACVCVCLGGVVLVSVTSFVQLEVERGATQILDLNKFLTFLLKAACGAGTFHPNRGENLLVS